MESVCRGNSTVGSNPTLSAMNVAAFRGRGSRIRRGARAVEWGGLENRWPGNRSVGSNPTLSAILTPHRTRRREDSKGNWFGRVGTR